MPDDMDRREAPVG